MANPTTYFGWVMPNSADLVTDLPADFNVFGQGVDTSMSQLLGGTTGQVLSKTSATNMAFTWVTPTDQTPLTTKGDLFTFTTVDARLGIGANNTVLTADSAQATGMKWATPAAGSFNTGFAQVGTSESTTSTSYTNLTTVLSTTVTTGTKALVSITVGFQNGIIANVGSFASFGVTGATTLAASDTYATRFFSADSSNLLVNGSGTWVVTGLTAGSNVFTAKYKSESGVTSNFVLRTISVVDLGS